METIRRELIYTLSLYPYLGPYSNSLAALNKLCMCLRLPLCTLNVIFLHAQAIPAGSPFLFCNINLSSLLVRFHEYVIHATYYFPHFSTTVPQLYILFQVFSHFLLHCNPQMASSETFLFIFLNFFFSV